jgi:FolB domain-containing protein
MLGIIGFENHKINCIIGDLPEERQHEQEIFVDLKVKADFSKCAQTDNLKDTIDYVRLAAICTNLASTKKYQMLETFACDVIESVLAEFPVLWAWIKIKKPAGLPTAQYAIIELEKHN